MDVILSGRGVDLTDALRRYATEKLTRAQRFFDRIIRMEVELSEERNRHGVEHRAQVTVHTPKETLRAHGEGDDHFAAIDKVTDRLESQLRRFKERLTHHPRGGPKGVNPNENELDTDVNDDAMIVRMEPQLTKPLTPEEARFELESRGLTFLLFTNAESMRSAVIFKRKTGFGLIEPEN